jgi:hypothetical protein
METPEPDSIIIMSDYKKIPFSKHRWLFYAIIIIKPDLKLLYLVHLIQYVHYATNIFNILPQKGLVSLVTKYKAPLPLDLSALIPIIPHGCAEGPLSLVHFCKVE